MNDQNETRSVYDTSKAIGAAILLFLLLSNILTLILVPIIELFTTNKDFQLSIASSITTIIVIIYLAKRYTKKLNFQIPMTVKGNWNYKTILITFIIFLGLNFIFSLLFSGINLLLQPLGYQLVDYATRFEPKNNIDLILQLLSICIIAPIFEEIFFRGIVLHGLKPYGNGFAIIISSLFFGMMHGSLLHNISMFICSLALGYLAIKTQSIIPGIIVHFLNNVLACVLTFLEVSSIGTIISVGLLLISAIYTIYFLLRHKVQIKEYWEMNKGEKISAFFSNWKSKLAFLLLILIIFPIITTITK